MQRSILSVTVCVVVSMQPLQARHGPRDGGRSERTFTCPVRVLAGRGSSLGDLVQPGALALASVAAAPLRGRSSAAIRHNLLGRTDFAAKARMNL